MTWPRDNTKGTKEPFVTASVINSQQGGKRITAKNSKTNEEVICDLSSADIFPANPADQFAPDHCALIHLNEPCILENSRGWALLVARGQRHWAWQAWQAVARP